MSPQEILSRAYHPPAFMELESGHYTVNFVARTPLGNPIGMKVRVFVFGDEWYMLSPNVSPDRYITADYFKQEARKIVEEHLENECEKSN